MSKGKYKAASDSLKKAISSIDSPYGKDLFNLAKCYSQLNEKDSCLYYIETALKIQDLTYVLETHRLWFEPILGEENWHELTSKNYFELPTPEKWQVDLIEEIKGLVKLDQHYRKILTDSIEVWHYNDTALISLYRDSVEYNDEIVQNELEHIIKKYGWPSQRVSGKHEAPAGAILIHSSDTWFQKMDSILIHEIEIGNLSPNSYAMVADRIRLRNNLSPLYNSYSATNNELTEEVIENCRKIGCSLPPFRECR